MDKSEQDSEELANPIVRTNMKVKKNTGMPKKAQFYDLTKNHKDAKMPQIFDG